MHVSKVFLHIAEHFQNIKNALHCLKRGYYSAIFFIMENNMKKIAGVLIASLALLCLLGCSKKNTAKADVPSQDELSASSAELQDPIEISFGDFDAMQEFSKKAQNGEFSEGQVVTIDGELSVFNTSVSIGQRKDGEFIGTTLVVDDWSEDDIPDDGSHAIVKATLKKNPDYYFLYLTASSSDVSVITIPSYWTDF